MANPLNSKRASLIVLLEQFFISSAIEIVDTLHTEGIQNMEELFGVQGEDWELLDQVFESNGIPSADRATFHAIPAGVAAADEAGEALWDQHHTVAAAAAPYV